MWDFIKIVLALFIGMILTVTVGLFGMTFIVIAAFLHFYVFDNSKEKRTPL